jgi:hypothetical protein
MTVVPDVVLAGLALVFVPMRLGAVVGVAGPVGAWRTLRRRRVIA